MLTATRIDLQIENSKSDKKVILLTITSTKLQSVNMLLNNITFFIIFAVFDGYVNTSS